MIVVVRAGVPAIAGYFCLVCHLWFILAFGLARTIS